MRSVRVPVLMSLALLAAACGGGGSTDAGDDVTTTAAPTTAAPTTAEVATSYAVATDEDVVYFDDGAVELAMNVYYPEESGPWPLVVVYHGMTTLPSNAVASHIAEMGAVAAAPRWLDSTGMTGEEYVSGDLLDRAACATSTAQMIGPDYGADPTQTVVVGFSAGIHPAGWVGLGVVRDDVCDAPLSELVRGVVLGDSQFILFEPAFDAAFADEASLADDTNARFLDPTRWNMSPEASVYLWTSGTNYSRAIDYPVPSESWIHARNATGDLIVDLELVDAFEDGKIDWMDNALLMELRMSEAGIEVFHESVGGSHSYSSAVYEGIRNMLTTIG